MGAPSVAEVGQVIAVKAVDENGTPVEWETVSVQGGTITDAVLFTEQKLTEEQKAQVRRNIQAVEDLVNDVTGEVVFNYPDNGTVQLKACYQNGKFCIFTLQLNIDTAISDSYGFTIANLPFAPVGRVWINNATMFYMDGKNNSIRVNESTLQIGNYILTGFFLVSDEA